LSLGLSDTSNRNRRHPPTAPFALLASGLRHMTRSVANGCFSPTAIIGEGSFGFPFPEIGALIPSAARKGGVFDRQALCLCMLAVLTLLFDVRRRCVPSCVIDCR
jgi:hypothetical protein